VRCYVVSTIVSCYIGWLMLNSQASREVFEYSRSRRRKLHPQVERYSAISVRNGSGKSTTVKMVMGMIRPTKGKFLFAGSKHP